MGRFPCVDAYIGSSAMPTWLDICLERTANRPFLVPAVRNIAAVATELASRTVGSDERIGSNLHSHMHGLAGQVLDDCLDHVRDIRLLCGPQLGLRPEKTVMVLRGFPVEHDVAEFRLLRWRGVRAIPQRRDRHGSNA